MNDWATAEPSSEYRALFEHVSDGLLVLDPESGAVRDANGRFVAMSGFDRDTLTDARLDDLLVEGSRSEAPIQSLVDAADDGRTVEWRFRRRTGTPFWADLSASLADLCGEQCVLTTVRDVTERRRRREELGRFEELVEHVPTGIFRAPCDPDGTFLEANPTMVDLFDAESKVDLLSTPVADIYADGDDCRSFFDALAERSVVTEKVELRTLTGDRFWGLVTVCRCENADGETYIDGAIKDVTETREYQQVLEEQNERLELLNRIVRHDIRNKMTVVQGRAELLAEDVDEDSRGHVDQILDNSERVIEITKEARHVAETLAETEEIDREAVDLADTLRTEIDDLRKMYPEAEVRVDGAVPDVSVTANDFLSSLFRNVLTNAVIHNDRPRPEVDVSATVTDDTAVVDIADNGPGIPAEVRETVFEAERFAPDKDGHGVGLYLVNSLASQYGGDIDIDTSGSRGTVVSIELPLYGRA